LFEIKYRDNNSNARAGELKLYHNIVKTPVFMPVGTNGVVKTFFPNELENIGIDIILSNSYHLYLRPGMDVISKLGGLHKFSSWNRNILTDSGGFQLFSLSKIVQIKDDGVEFRSHIDGSKHFLTPDNVVEIQKIIGSDIMMVLDHCTPPNISYDKAKEALTKTTRWASVSREYYKNNIQNDRQKMFGIVQGNFFKDLRERSAKELIDLDFDGYAIGGLSVGESTDIFNEIVHFTTPLLPTEKSRYLMGVGTPEYILTSVEAGIDMFDCVFPTRIARNASVLTKYGRLNMRNEKYKYDDTTIDEDCDCYVCKNFSKSYLRHLFKANEITASRLASYHNIYFMKIFMDRIRESIISSKFLDFKIKFLSSYLVNGS